VKAKTDVWSDRSHVQLLTRHITLLVLLNFLTSAYKQQEKTIAFGNVLEGMNTNIVGKQLSLFVEQILCTSCHDRIEHKIKPVAT
jgi:hypothetical protein